MRDPVRRQLATAVRDYLVGGIEIEPLLALVADAGTKLFLILDEVLRTQQIFGDDEVALELASRPDQQVVGRGVGEAIPRRLDASVVVVIAVDEKIVDSLSVGAEQHAPIRGYGREDLFRMCGQDVLVLRCERV